MNPKDTKKRIEEAYKLLAHETTSREKFESIRTLIKGLSPKIDMLLESTSKALSNIQKLQKGDIIVLSAESLPENSPEEKKRKQVLIFLINSWRQLEAEVKRMSLEFENFKSDNTSSEDKITSVGRMASSIKGPFGLITIGAIIVVGISIFFVKNSNNELIKQNNTDVLPAQTTPRAATKIQVIIFNGKKLPLTELHIGRGPECMNSITEVDHYHALRSDTVKALDGTFVEDPGGCGFGKVEETEIVEIE